MKIITKKSTLILLLCLALSSTNIETFAKSKVDPLLNIKDTNYQYQFDVINLKKAWDLLEEKGYTPTKVGVMDTGIDPQHEDLTANLKEYVSIKKGTIQKGTEDPEEHGTHVSGIIAATYGNGKGGAGVATGYKNDMVQLYVAGVSDDDGNINSIDMEKAIEYFRSKGVRVINMSLGSYEYDDDVQRLIKKAYDDGLVLVSASGNEDTDKKSSPSSFKEVIAVNASDNKNNIAHFSDYGYETDVSAPGFNVPSTLPGDRYIQMSGTSMASPVVAGVASLVLSANKDLTPRQVYNIICGTANKQKMNGAFFDKDQYAYGVVDAYEAVKAAYEIKENPSKTVENIFIKNKVYTVLKGYKTALEIIPQPCTTLSEVTWSSSDENIVTVDKEGYLDGKRVGQATITAKAGDKSASCFINVKEEVLPKRIELKKKSATMSEGQLDKLALTVYPKEALVKDWYVKSSDDKVAVGFPNLGIYAKKRGKALITIRTVNDLENTYELTVKPAVSRIKWIKKLDKINLNKNFKFKAVALNSDNTEDLLEKGVKWSVSDESLASISKLGVFKPKKPGKVFVKVTSNGLGKDGKNHVSRVIAVKVTSNGSHQSPKKVKKYKVEERIKVKAQHLLDTEEKVKSQALESISNLYNVILAKRSKYSKTVLAALETLRREATAYIDEAAEYDLYKEELDPESEEYVLNSTGKLKEFEDVFSVLEGYTTLETGYNCNLKKLKANLYKATDSKFKEIGFENYNEYYAQLMKTLCKKSLKTIKNARTILDLARAELKIPIEMGNDLEFMKLDEIIDFDRIYTLTDTNRIKKLLKRELSAYSEELKLSRYPKIKKFNKYITKCKKNLDKLLYVGEMLNQTALYIDEFVKKTGVEYQLLVSGERNKIYADIDEILKKYAPENYSDKNWEKIKDIMQEAYDKILEAKYKAELYNIKKYTEEKIKKIKVKSKIIQKKLTR